MSENERMERAKRIRRMREGDREEPADNETTDEGTGDRSEERTVELTGSTNGQSNPTTDADPTDGQTKANLMDGQTETDPMDGQTEVNPTERQTNDETVSGAKPQQDSVEDAQAESEEASGAKAPLPDAEQLEAALEGDNTETAESVDPAVEGTDGTEDEESEAAESAEKETRVLEFTLDDEHYCLDIKYIEEIVKQETVTRVPNTPAFVEGVVDLRGQITTILNPKVTLEKQNDEAGELVVVFDGDAFEEQGYIGWVVDDVRQVAPIRESEVNDPPMQEEYINGVIDRDDDEDFVIWTTPDLALEEAG